MRFVYAADCLFSATADFKERTMGRAGLPVSLLALGYLIFVVIWMPFPQELPVTGSNMNYAGPLLGAVILGALLDWTISGHKRFQVLVSPKV